MNKNTHIEIAVPLPVHSTYTYKVPEHLQPMVETGKRVLAPFGRRRVTGYILGPGNLDDAAELKEIIEILDEAPLFPPAMIAFFKWMADYYIHPLGEVISEALPAGINVNERVMLHITAAGKNALAGNELPHVECGILNAIQATACSFPDLCKKLGREISSRAIGRMEDKGFLIRKREMRKAQTRPRTERFVRPTEGILPDPLSEKQQLIINAIRAEGEISIKELNLQIPAASNLIRTLEKKGLLTLFNREVYRDPFGDSVCADAPPKLTIEQQRAVSEVRSSLGKGFAAFLLAGVTGSGKTEVYMQAAAEALQKNCTALILVPEIALTTEMERRFRGRFGECVAVLHSGLSAGERLDQWRRAANSESPIVIGARSAIFAPLSRLGLIIVDEEHDTSYKQESRFRYNARDMAIVRARLEGAVVLLGSATPSVHSIYNVATRKFHELNLKKRIYQQDLPEVCMVDLKKHKDFRGIWRFITPLLHQALKETLERKEQALLFLNRRGFATYPVCAGCGQPLKCRHCDMTLTLHQKASVYKCHLCGFRQPASSVCKVCGSSAIKRLGMGTEKIEQAVKALFPSARVARMDRDTISHRDSLINILKSLRNHEIDILIGTQMVAKGHDFPKITLVGIICADLSLSFPDFRAGELTFQVLAQVAGRAGRGDRPGRVILQTYNPDHFSIETAKTQDFMAFYNQEIFFRKTFRYPPFSRMILLKISGRDAEKAKDFAIKAGQLCRELNNRDPQFQNKIEVLGPIEAPLTRIAKHYRWQILIKSPGAQALHRFVRKLIFEEGLGASSRKVTLAVDVDPFFMM
ncbi:MAG: primosomal protein N' [Desulfobacterales bacterium]|nr:primosomal protein N' [Desulfobacterales bacterium]